MSNSKGKQLKLKGIRPRKDSEDMKNLASIMPTTYENIEKSSYGKYSTGVPVSFHDLDAMTQGLQRGSLVVAAGRPSMGKTSFAMNLAKNVAKTIFWTTKKDLYLTAPQRIFRFFFWPYMPLFASNGARK